MGQTNLNCLHQNILPLKFEYKLSIIKTAADGQLCISNVSLCYKLLTISSYFCNAHTTMMITTDLNINHKYKIDDESILSVFVFS